MEGGCTQDNALNESRHYPFVASVSGKIFIAGGMQKHEQIRRVLNSCEMYNPFKLTNSR